MYFRGPSFPKCIDTISFIRGTKDHLTLKSAEALAAQSESISDLGHFVSQLWKTCVAKQQRAADNFRLPCQRQLDL